MLDKHTIGRIEGIIHTQSLLNLKVSLTTIIQDMIDNGLAEEYIFEYIKGIVIERIEDADWE
jgi:hypothetical protein